MIRDRRGRAFISESFPDNWPSITYFHYSRLVQHCAAISATAELLLFLLHEVDLQLKSAFRTTFHWISAYEKWGPNWRGEIPGAWSL